MPEPPPRHTSPSRSDASCNSQAKFFFRPRFLVNEIFFFSKGYAKSSASSSAGKQAVFQLNLAIIEVKIVGKINVNSGFFLETN